jgi:hypothetical protein
MVWIELGGGLFQSKMMTLSRIALTLLALVGAWTSANHEKSLKVGQEWEFQGRPGDPKPVLVILKVEHLPKLGEVVHVSVRGIHIKNPRAPTGSTDTLPHVPFSRLALEKSVTRLLHDSVAIPDYSEGYEQWRRAGGGAFTTSVREALDFVEKALSQ